MIDSKLSNQYLKQFDRRDRLILITLRRGFFNRFYLHFGTLAGATFLYLMIISWIGFRIDQRLLIIPLIISGGVGGLYKMGKQTMDFFEQSHELDWIWEVWAIEKQKVDGFKILNEEMSIFGSIEGYIRMTDLDTMDSQEFDIIKSYINVIPISIYGFWVITIDRVE